MNLKLLFISAVFLAFGCAASNPSDIEKDSELSTDKSINLFNGVKFYLDSDEEEAPMSADLTALYESYTLDSDIQVPLFKCIGGDGHTVFLSLPIGFNFDKFKGQKVLKEGFELVSSEMKEGEFSYRVYTNNGKTFVEYVCLVKNSKFYTMHIYNGDNNPGSLDYFKSKIK